MRNLRTTGNKSQERIQITVCTDRNDHSDRNVHWTFLLDAKAWTFLLDAKARTFLPEKSPQTRIGPPNDSGTEPCLFITEIL